MDLSKRRCFLNNLKKKDFIEIINSRDASFKRCFMLLNEANWVNIIFLREHW